jgi:hypothetical protein
MHCFRFSVSVYSLYKHVQYLCFIFVSFISVVDRNAAGIERFTGTQPPVYNIALIGKKFATYDGSLSDRRPGSR